jgi:hypothetical protein
MASERRGLNSGVLRRGVQPLRQLEKHRRIPSKTEKGFRLRIDAIEV